MAVVAGMAGVAGFASLASAVELNPDGLGQVLIYPYYTVNKNQQTLLSVVNTDSENAKVVKVRFLEGYNSREVLDFNLFLSPNDVWTGTVNRLGNDDDAGAGVKTADHSCTFPPFPAADSANPYQPFRTYAFDGTLYKPNGIDGGPTDVSRTREGYLEMIQMADVARGTDLFDTILHVNGVPDCDPGLIGNSITGSTELSPPTGGLFGSGSIINVGQGTFFGYNADAIDGFYNTVHITKSGDLEPSLSSADVPAIAYVFNNGALLSLDYTGQEVDAVSALYQADTLYNEYITNSNLGATTDWVVTFPTKRFYVDKVYTPTAIQPFYQSFDKVSNVEVQLTPYDQEEGTTIQQDCDPSNPTPGSDCDWSPSPPPEVEPSSLPYEVNVISFLDPDADGAGETSGVLGSRLVFNVPPFASAGWIRLDLASGNGGTHLLRPAANGTQLRGLPATGFEVYNVINAHLNGDVMANYSGLFRHRASKSCAAGACS